MQRSTSAFQIAPAAGQSFHNRGLTGRGVGIAVIDSGVSAPEEFGDRLVVGADFTVDGATQDHGRDRTGHGTHLAGVAAGARTGVAPGAHVVNVKVAGEGGATDPMAVIAAIDWTVANRRRLQLGVLLLAFGADQFEAGRDPLAEAVARAWKAGLVVVTSAGNEGDAPLPTPSHIAEVLTVGAGELVNGTWQRCNFSNVGRTGERADLLAPGRSVVGPVAHGSDAAVAPEPSFVGPAHVKGSGSSQAAAVAAGAAALLLEADGSLTPDEVKRILCTSASRLDDPGAGAGAMDLDLALALLASGLFREAEPQSVTATAARAWAGLEWSGMNWRGMNWRGMNWRGMNWRGMNWRGLEWSGMNWRGMNWRGLEWSGMNWRGMNWRGLEWSGMNWRGMNWRGLEWSGMNWR
jgi:serine protease AprX